MASSESSQPNAPERRPAIVTPTPEGLPAADTARIRVAVGEGGLIAFPTDTVYGVGANAGDARAIGRLYDAKQRPRRKALPLLVADASDVEALAHDVPDAAWALIERFWPGALTIVLPRTDAVCPEAVSGGDTVALRQPDSRIARATIRAAGTPLAVTSANRSGGPETIDSAEVLRTLGRWLSVVVESGEVAGGRPSTLVNLASDTPQLLREGPISRRRLEAVVGPLA